MSRLRSAALVLRPRITRARPPWPLASHARAAAARSSGLRHSGVRERSDLSSFSPASGARRGGSARASACGRALWAAPWRARAAPFLRPGSPTSSYCCSSPSGGAAAQLQRQGAAQATASAQPRFLGAPPRRWRSPGPRRARPCCSAGTHRPQAASCEGSRQRKRAPPAPTPPDGGAAALNATSS